jgi:hypothetical protein
LVLKAYLIERGVELAKLKKQFAHDLERLWNASLHRGLRDVIGKPDKHFSADLRDANHYYKAKVFEYFSFRRWAGRYEGLPSFERFANETRRIVRATRAHCISEA